MEEEEVIGVGGEGRWGGGGGGGGDEHIKFVSSLLLS